MGEALIWIAEMLAGLGAIIFTVIGFTLVAAVGAWLFRTDVGRAVALCVLLIVAAAALSVALHDIGAFAIHAVSRS